MSYWLEYELVDRARISLGMKVWSQFERRYAVTADSEFVPSDFDHNMATSVTNDPPLYSESHLGYSVQHRRPIHPHVDARLADKLERRIHLKRYPCTA